MLCNEAEYENTISIKCFSSSSWRWIGTSAKPRAFPLNQILYLDVSKPFNTANPPFEILNISIPFGSTFATAFLSSQKDVIYLFGGKNNEWTIPTTNGIAPEHRRAINGVINNENGKFYVFSGHTDYFTGANNTRALNDMNIFDTISLTWSKDPIENAPLPRVGYTATLLSNGIIVYIAPDERIIIFGGSRNDRPVLNQLAVLNTKIVSVPTPAPPLPLTTHSHSATLVGNYMFINFGKLINLYSVF
ncbi:hypothetical protein C1646_665127 [Rhizophagus diaphanus]|nr:hypothetical protein C1646_665127 [Rhizophagus diaphanus] [Rhizophagus sp. MUCL 43196]